MTQTKRDPLLRTPEEWEGIQQAQAVRAKVDAACSRGAEAVSMEAIAAKYPRVAALVSASKLMLATLQGFTFDELRSRLADVHGPSFDAASMAMWDALTGNRTTEGT